IARRQQRYRPVAAKRHTVLAEDLDRVLDIRPQVRGDPALLVGLGHGAADLADNIRQRRQLAHLLAPGVEQMAFDIWLAQVIEDEADLGAAADELGGGRKLGMEDADVERETILGQQLYAVDEIRPQAEVDLCFALKQAPYALDERTRRDQRVEERARP